MKVVAPISVTTWIITLFLPTAALGNVSEDVTAWQEALGHYLEVAKQYGLDLDTTLKQTIARRRRAIEDRFARESEQLEREVRQRRLEAIRTLEGFLSRYPDNERYTPEVMFRLGELYLEKAQDDYNLAYPEYEKLHELWRRGKIAEEPQEPEKNYAPAIQTYEALLSRFPRYKNADAVRYALAFCLSDAGDRERATAVWRDLVTQNPNSQFVGQAWVMIGDYYFDTAGYDKAMYEKAAEAYNHAIETRDPKVYEYALYKLAWSYFQKYDYPQAIMAFKRLISEIDEGKRELEQGAQLRAEAIEYLGYSLAEDDWDGDGIRDPDATVQRALSYLSEGKPFEREVLEKYADALYAQHEAAKYPMAIEAYRQVIARDPMHPGNVAVKEKIINTYEAMRDEEARILERVDLVRQFGPGSAWYEANKKRPEVIARVDRQVELALEQAAGFRHLRARKLRADAAARNDPAIGAAAIKEYREAAAAYAEYLRQFPRTREAYKLTYYYAECLYYSYDFEAAARQYEKVRDWPGMSEFQEPAAYAVIDSLEKEAAKRAADGLIPKEQIPGEIGEVKEEAGPGGEGKVTITPKPIPPLTQEWIKAVDIYLERGLSRPNDPDLPARLAYRVANEYYKYLHLEEARRRFQAIIEKYPEHLVASYAGLNIINSYRLENDWENIQIWGKKLEELKLGTPEERAKLHEEVKLFQLGAQFKEAEALFEAGEYVKAAEAFVAVVDRDPKFKFADRALQNAAVAYQKARHYDSAARVYERIISDYPQSQYIEGALLQLAENSKKFYDFDRAVRSYLALRARFPNSKYAAYALHMASVLVEAEGRLEEAVRLCEDYAKAYPESEEAPQVLVRAAKSYEKLGRSADVIRVAQWFISKYGSNPKMSEQVIMLLGMVADIHHASGNRKEWEKVARQIIREFDARGLQPETSVAAYPAKMQFLLVEPLYEEYASILITGNLAQQGKKIERKINLLKQLEAEYSKVLPYKAFEWSTAALYRMAKIHEDFADALFKADVPEMDPEALEIYRQELEERSAGFLETAQQRYRKVIDEARRLKIANEWVNRAREAMNKYNPNEYPLYKEERRATESGVRLVLPFEEAL